MSGFTPIQQSKLDYIYKRDTVGVVKTDSNTTVATQEKIPTGFSVGLEDVWMDSVGLTAGTTGAVASNIVKKANDVFNASYNAAHPNNTVNFSCVPMTSVHDVGSSQDYTGLLKGQAWQTGIKNWISPNYHSSFEPKFYVGASNLTPTFDSNNNISSGFYLLGSTPSCPFLFDYKSGVLTFLLAPAVSTGNYDLTSVSLVNGVYVTNYKIWVSGYIYTGKTLLTTPVGSGSTGSGTTDSALVMNIGKNAYVYGATGTAPTYDQATGTITFPQTNIYGNSTTYRVYYSMYPVTGNLTDNILNSLYYNTITDHGVYPQNFSIQNKAHTISNDVIAGSYTPTLNVNTYEAGGTGTGSSFSVVFPSVTVTTPDLMGNPQYDPTVYYSQNGTIYNLTTDYLITISGLRYYTTGTTLNIYSGHIGATGIYNTIPNPPEATVKVFKFYQGDSTNELGSYSFNSTDLYWKTPGTNVPTSPTAGGTGTSPGDYYYSKSTKFLTIESTYPPKVVVTNQKGYSTGRLNLYTVNGVTTKGIAFVPNTFADEVTLPKDNIINQLAVVTDVKRIANKVQSSDTAPYAPQTVGPYTSNLITSLYSFDPAYNPFTNEYFAQNIQTYILSTLYYNSAATGSFPTFTPGTRYLVIRLTTSSILPAFTLTLSPSEGSITTLFIKWHADSNNTDYGWYNGKQNRDSTDSNGYVGCSSNTPNNGSYYIKTPSSIDTNDVYISGPGYVDVCIGFTGRLPANNTGILFSPN